MSQQILGTSEVLFGIKVLYIRSVIPAIVPSTSNGQHMAAPAGPLKQLHRPAQLPRASSPREELEDFGRYRLQAVAASITDAVLSIGGLIFDHAMAGWDVSVVVDQDTDRGIDYRPIRILGGRVTRRLADPNRAGVLPRPHLLAVATDVMAKSDALRRRVLAVGNDKEADVLLWGRPRPTNLNCRFVAVRHRPSAAAQVFKSQALAAGGTVVTHSADEGYYSMA